jgi:hypothetical protein
MPTVIFNHNTLVNNTGANIKLVDATGIIFLADNGQEIFITCGCVRIERNNTSYVPDMDYTCPDNTNGSFVFQQNMIALQDIHGGIAVVFT